MWNHPEVSLILDDKRILALAKHLAHCTNDATSSAAVLADLVRVANAKSVQFDNASTVLAAVLLSLAPPRSSDYAVGATALLSELTRTKRFGSALFVWKSIYQQNISAFAQDQLIVLFQGLFDRLNGSPITSDLEALDLVCNDLFWAVVETGMQNLLAVVGLGSFVLSQKSLSDIGRDLALQIR